MSCLVVDLHTTKTCLLVLSQGRPKRGLVEDQENAIVIIVHSMIHCEYLPQHNDASRLGGGGEFPVWPC